MLNAFAGGRPGDDCIVLRGMYDAALKSLARARIRQLDLQDLRKQIDTAIAQVEKKVGLHTAFAAVVAETIAAPIGIGLTVLNGKTPRQQVQSWKDLLRSLRLDRRLADAYLDRNQKLIESLSELKGRLEGLHAAKCKEGGTAPPPPPDFKVGLRTSYMHPGGSTSTLCVRVTTSPAKPDNSARVQFSGPGVVGAADQIKTLDAAGAAVANVTINAYGTYTATATVTDSGVTRSATASQEVAAAQATCPPP